MTKRQSMKNTVKITDNTRSAQTYNMRPNESGRKLCNTLISKLIRRVRNDSQQNTCWWRWQCISSRNIPSWETSLV